MHFFSIFFNVFPVVTANCPSPLSEPSFSLTHLDNDADLPSPPASELIVMEIPLWLFVCTRAICHAESGRYDNADYFQAVRAKTHLFLGIMTDRKRRDEPSKARLTSHFAKAPLEASFFIS